VKLGVVAESLVMFEAVVMDAVMTVAMESATAMSMHTAMYTAATPTAKAVAATSPAGLRERDAAEQDDEDEPERGTVGRYERPMLRRSLPSGERSRLVLVGSYLGPPTPRYSASIYSMI
jgi:hypothetical protein